MSCNVRCSGLLAEALRKSKFLEKISNSSNILYRTFAAEAEKDLVSGELATLEGLHVSKVTLYFPMCELIRPLYYCYC